MDRVYYDVVAGGVGTVYSGANKTRAKKAYRQAVHQAMLRGWGGVTVFRDGDIIKEYSVEDFQVQVS